MRGSEASHPFQKLDSSEGKVLSGELNPHLRLLLGPGPSPVHPRILKAMSTHVVGHLDPDFLAVMDDCQVMLRDLFNTENQVTFPVSGTGSAAMEASVCNIIEPGDKAIICVNGVFGGRMSDVAARYGAEVVTVEAPVGQAYRPKGREGGPRRESRRGDGRHRPRGNEHGRAPADGGNRRDVPRARRALAARLRHLAGRRARGTRQMGGGESPTAARRSAWPAHLALRPSPSASARSARCASGNRRSRAGIST